MKTDHRQHAILDVSRGRRNISISETTPSTYRKNFLKTCSKNVLYNFLTGHDMENIFVTTFLSIPNI